MNYIIAIVGLSILVVLLVVCMIWMWYLHNMEKAYFEQKAANEYLLYRSKTLIDQIDGKLFTLSGIATDVGEIDKELRSGLVLVKDTISNLNRDINTLEQIWEHGKGN